MIVDSINPDCCYQWQIVSICINYTGGAIRTQSCSHDGWHVFSSDKWFLSLSRHVRTCKVGFLLWSPARFRKFSPNSSLIARARFNHVTAEVLSSLPSRWIEVGILYSPFLPCMFTTPETRREVLDSCWIPDEPPKDVDGRNLWWLRFSQQLCFSLRAHTDVCSILSLRLIELVIIINIDWCLGFCDLITACDLPDKRETSRLWLKKTLSLFIPRSWTCLSRKNQ